MIHRYVKGCCAQINRCKQLGATNSLQPKEVMLKSARLRELKYVRAELALHPKQPTVLTWIKAS
jgi:hypothetical protein